MSEPIEVCAASDLADGEVEIVDLEGDRSVGVFNVGGEYYALLNYCVHQGGPLCEGEVYRKVEAEFQGSGERIAERYGDDRVVTCPWHGWEYDLETGENIANPDVAVPSFDVEEEDGVLYVLA